MFSYPGNNNRKRGLQCFFVSREEYIHWSTELLKAGVHFRAKRANDFFFVVFAWKKRLRHKKVSREQKKVGGKFNFFRSTNDVTTMLKMFRAKVDTGLKPDLLTTET